MYCGPGSRVWFVIREQTHNKDDLVEITVHERSVGKSVCNSIRKIVIHVRCFRDAARFQTSPLDIRPSECRLSIALRSAALTPGSLEYRSAASISTRPLSPSEEMPVAD